MDVFLHLGTPKTGTSSIQNQLGDNREVLARRGILYPQLPGHGRHGRLGLYIRSDEELDRMPGWRRGKGRELTPAQFRDWFHTKSLLEISEAAPRTLVYSDEGLWPASDGALQRLGEFVREFAEHVHVVVYLRRQDDHLVSRYQQAVKTGTTLTMAEFVGQDRSRLYDYAARLAHVSGILAPDSVRVRPFERSAFPEQSLSLDFFETIGEAGAHADLAPLRQQRNESLSADAVEFLRLVNLMRVKQDGMARQVIDHRPYLVEVGQRLVGPALTAPPEQLDALMDLYGPTNAVVARDYCGRDDGVLFRELRKSTNVTTTQRLEVHRAREALDALDTAGWPAAERERLLALVAGAYDS